MTKDPWCWLQLFAEGDGGEGGAPTGENAVDPGTARLKELGVPDAVLNRRAKRFAGTASAAPAAPAAAKQEAPRQEEQAAAAEESPTEAQEEKPARMTWDQVKADPEYNREIQNVVKARLKTAGKAQEALDAFAPALELLARQYGMDIANLDHAALAEKISNDDRYYEDKAAQLGTSVEHAKQFDKLERDAERMRRETERRAQLEKAFQDQQRYDQHFAELEQQAEAMKKVFPNFDLRTEMQNKQFVQMTAPGGVSVEQAYYALHHQQIQQAAMEATQTQTAKKLSNAIQAGAKRPREAGTSSQAPSVTSFDWSKASKADREALKARIRAGERILPGQR